MVVRDGVPPERAGLCLYAFGVERAGAMAAGSHSGAGFGTIGAQLTELTARILGLVDLF